MDRYVQQTSFCSAFQKIQLENKKLLILKKKNAMNTMKLHSFSYVKYVFYYFFESPHTYLYLFFQEQP